MNKYSEYKEIYKGLIKEALFGKMLQGAKQFGKTRLDDLAFLATQGTGEGLHQGVRSRYSDLLRKADVAGKSDDFMQLLKDRMVKEHGNIDMKALQGMGTAAGLGAGLLGAGAASGYAAAPDQENVTAFEALKRGNIF